METFTVFIHIVQEINLKNIKWYVKVMIITIQKGLKKIIKYNHGEKSLKMPFVFYAELECLLEKIDTSHSNPKKSSTT